MEAAMIVTSLWAKKNLTQPCVRVIFPLSRRLGFLDFWLFMNAALLRIFHQQITDINYLMAGCEKRDSECIRKQRAEIKFVHWARQGNGTCVQWVHRCFVVNWGRKTAKKNCGSCNVKVAKPLKILKLTWLQLSLPLLYTTRIATEVNVGDK